MDKVVLVTGSNRGIGKEVVKQLGNKGYKVILASRDAEKGKQAVKEINLSNVEFHQLDVTDERSRIKIRDFILNKYGKLDILINNAGILIDRNSIITEVDLEDVLSTFETNALAPLRMSQLFFPSMVKNNYGRIVNVSSEYGQISSMDGDYCPAYKLSKAALNAITKMLALNKSNDGSILVNCCCPGWVKTDMGGKEATKSVEEGADTIVWLATLPNTGPTGKFFTDREEIDW